MKVLYTIERRSLVAAFLFLSAFFAATSDAAGQSSQPTIRIVLPARFRVLTGQFFDLRVEAENLESIEARMQIAASDDKGRPEPINFAGQYEVSSDNDNTPNKIDRAYTYRKVSFATPGVKTIRAILTDGARTYGAETQISLQNFNLRGGKNIVLFIGDALGTAYRDAGRIVGQGAGGRLRQGWFDELQQMDKMPVTGMAMTYSLENVVPDSANTASAWAAGNKTINGALNVFPDNNDFRYSATDQQATKRFALDNPRVETLWQYLKRRYKYKTGIVTTADVTDATPAAEGAHTVTRTLLKDVARQYVDGTVNAGIQFDVILGGGLEQFTGRTAANSGDTRNLLDELKAAGFTSVANRKQLNAINEAAPPGKLVGLFRKGSMNVAYDKLRLTRPTDEPTADLGEFTDQPFLDEMTRKAIAVLGRNSSPFILLVEAGLIDVQSHSNYAAGQIWDTIEFDKAVGVGRAFMNATPAARARNLMIVTADHDQSMSIIGTVDSSVPNSVQNVSSTLPYPGVRRGGEAGKENRIGESPGFPDYTDANGDGYPENTNRKKLKVGYRTGVHGGSSVPVTAEGAGALLFYGYFDQTDIFFKMAKALTINTQALDAALKYKCAVDVSVFLPKRRGAGNGNGSPSKVDGIIWMENAPLGRVAAGNEGGRRAP